MNDQVSVIIPTYNHGNFVCDAIESVLNQTYKQFEVVVIDDGSCDDTKVKLEKYDGRIRYIYQENKGLSTARNTGILNSTSRYIAFLDADDIWLSDKLAIQMDLMRCDKNIGLINVAFWKMFEDGQIILQHANYNISNQKVFMDKLLINNIVGGGGSGALVRRECFDKVGLFDQTLKSAEDWDMWIRICRFYTIKVINKPLVIIRDRHNSMCSVSNASSMLHNDLTVIHKAFRSPEFKKRIFLKQKAVSFRYCESAWAYSTLGQSNKAKRYLLHAIINNPLYFLTTDYCLGLLIKIFLGIIIFNIIKKLFRLVIKPNINKKQSYGKV